MATTTKATNLPESTFNVDVQNHVLLKQAYDAYLSNSRQAGATTLKRGEVSGGGKKPWKQKGTGRARFGSSRNPIWRGGGVVFGPSGNENYTKKLSTTSKRIAIKQALSLANKAGKISTADISTTGKTSEVAKYLADNNYNRRTLVVVEEKSAELLRATNNIQSVKVVRSTYLNVYDVLNADHIVISPASVATIDTWLNGGAK